MNRVLCYRCGGHVKDGGGGCASCGQRFDPGLQAGPAAGFGAGIRRSRHAIEGSPCQPGEVVAGRYQVRDHVGAGPLGWMFRAFEVNSELDVALKILSPRFLQMPEEKRVFQAELNQAQRLAHANIARIYEAGEEHGRPFIASQHLEGLTLRRIMDLRRQKGQRFTLQEVEPIVAQIAAALDAAALAHGNLKPDNVIVLPDLLKLTDFGLAVSLPRAPFMAAQKAAGVHRYLAPEFLLGDPLEPRTDVFSLGVMLGEMLSGAQYEQQLSLLDKNPDLPAPVETLFRRAVSPRAAARFASAGEMAAELSELVASAPRPPPPPRPVEDAGDVVIVEAHTDPRLRIARALGAMRAPDPASTPPMERRPQASLIPEPAAAALASLPLAPEPFTPPPPYEPSMPPPRPLHHAEPAAPAAPEIAPPAAAVEEQVAPENGEGPGLKDRPRRGVGKRGKGRIRRTQSGAAADPAWAAGVPTEAAVAIGPTTPSFKAIQVRQVTRAPPLVRIEETRPSRAPIYAIAVVGAAVIAAGAYTLLPRSGAPAPDAQPAVEPVQAAKSAEPPRPTAAPAKVEAVRDSRSVVPSRRSSSTDRLGDKIRSVRERVEKALQEHKRKREQAQALATTRRREEEAMPFKPMEITAPVPVRQDLVCPPGMVKVPGGPAAVGSDGSDDLRNFGDRALSRVELRAYCIDVYEFPNLAGKLPKVAATWDGAESECKNAGKRLCSEDEWENACRGPQNLRFPYGAGYDADACNTADKADNPRQTNVAGAFSRCKSGYGVMDLSGNAAEWTASAFDSVGPERAVKGGHAARPGFDDRCASRRKLAPGAHDIKVGFRCCADAR